MNRLFCLKMRLFSVCIFITFALCAGSFATPVTTAIISQEDKLLADASALLTMGEIEKAKIIYNELLVNNPKLIRGYIGLAQVDARRGNYQAVEKHFATAFKIDSENDVLYSAYGRYLLLQKKGEEAANAFKSALRINPQQTAANIELAVIDLSKENNSQSAVDRYKIALENEPENIAYLYGFSLALKKNGEVIEAINALDKIIVLNEAIALPHKLKASYFSALGDHENAVSNYVTMLEKTERATEQEYVMLGDAYIAAGKYGSAINTYFVCTNMFGENVILLTKLGYAHHVQNKFEQANDFYLRAIKKDPSYPDPYNNLSYIFIEQKNTVKAVEYAKLAVERSRNNPFFRDTLGKALMANKEYKEAVTQLEEAIKLMPNNLEIQQNLLEARKVLRQHS